MDVNIIYIVMKMFKGPTDDTEKTLKDSVKIINNKIVVY